MMLIGVLVFVMRDSEKTIGSTRRYRKDQPITLLAWSGDGARIAIHYPLTDRAWKICGYIMFLPKQEACTMLLAVRSGHATELAPKKILMGLCVSEDGMQVGIGTMNGLDVISAFGQVKTHLVGYVSSLASATSGPIIARAGKEDLSLLRILPDRCNVEWSKTVKPISSEVVFSASGRLIAIGQGADALLFIAETGAVAACIATSATLDQRLSLAISPNEQVLACGWSDKVGLWDIRTSSLISCRTVGGDNVKVGFLHNGRLVTAPREGHLAVWDSETLRDATPQHLRGLSEVTSFAVSSDGETIAVGDRHGVLHLVPVSKPPEEGPSAER